MIRPKWCILQQHGASSEFAYFKEDVNINGIPCVINLDVKKTSAKNHFHIHYVRIERKDSALLTSAPEGQKFNETQNPSKGRIADNGEEVKRSIPTEDYEELKRQHENTLRENDIFRHLVDYLERTLETTKGTEVSQKSIDKVVNKIFRKYKSGADKAEFTAAVSDLFKEMSAEGSNKSDFMYLAEMALRPVLEQSKDNKQISDYAKGILMELRGTTVKLDGMQKKEASYHYGSYNDFRRKLFGRVNFSDKGTDLA